MANSGPQQNWIPDVSTFGARLALVRWRMGWNLREAERECNLTQNTWSGYESGKEPRSFIEVVNRIVLRTQVDKLWLMTGEGSPSGPTGNGSDSTANDLKHDGRDAGTGREGIVTEISEWKKRALISRNS